MSPWNAGHVSDLIWQHSYGTLPRSFRTLPANAVDVVDVYRHILYSTVDTRKLYGTLLKDRLECTQIAD